MAWEKIPDFDLLFITVRIYISAIVNNFYTYFKQDNVKFCHGFSPSRRRQSIKYGSGTSEEDSPTKKEL